MYMWLLYTLSFTNCYTIQCLNLQLWYHDVIFANVWCYIYKLQTVSSVERYCYYAKLKKKNILNAVWESCTSKGEAIPLGEISGDWGQGIRKVL